MGLAVAARAARAANHKARKLRWEVLLVTTPVSADLEQILKQAALEIYLKA